MPWWIASSVSRSRSGLLASSIEMPRWAAKVMDSRTRSSESMRPATYIVVAGTPSRRASSTELRPATMFGPCSLFFRFACAEAFWFFRFCAAL